MEYRFPSAMGEEEAAGGQLNYSWLLDVQAKCLERFPVEHRQEVPNVGLLEAILLAVQECPSGEFILHDKNGNILKEH